MKEIYEPITIPQITKIHAAAKEYGISKEDLYSMITELISIPVMTALSRQEATYVIEKITGDEEWGRPPRTHTEEEIPEGESLPTMRQIVAIRGILKALDWEQAHIKAWLKKYRHIASIRELDREQARDTYLALKAIQEHALKNAGTSGEGE